MLVEGSDQRRAAALLAIANDGIVEVAADWTITYLSDQTYHLLAPDSIGRVLWDALGDSAGAYFTAECHRAMESRKPVEFSEYRSATGIWYVFRVIPHGDGLMISFRDISHEKMQEIEARGSWELMNNILDALPVGVWVLDAKGTIVASNPAARRIWGGARYVGMDSFGEYVGWQHGSDTPIDPEEWPCTRALNGETVFDQEADIQTFDGKRKTIRHSAIPLHGPDGTIIGAISVNQDITAEKEQQEALAQAWVHAKKANIARSRMVAALAHDLLQPLLGVRLHLTGLLANVPAATAHTLNGLIGSLLSVETLVESLMENAAFETGKIMPQIETVDLGDTVSHVVCELAAIADTRNLRLHCRARPNGAKARTDPVLLQRALRNLITNALHSTRVGGVLVGVRPRGQSLFIEVWDSGPGIEGELLNHYLNDTHPPAKTPHGFGIGLQTVKTIVQKLGIDLSARSVVGKGTVFRLRVPLG